MAELTTNTNATSNNNINWVPFKQWVKDTLIPKGMKSKQFRTVNTRRDPNDPSKRIATDPYNTLRFYNREGKCMDKQGNPASDESEELIIKVAKATQEKQGMSGTDFTWDWVKDNIDALQIGEVVSMSGLHSMVLALGAVTTDVDMSDFD